MLILAILPITFNIDLIFYACSIVAISCFMLSIFLSLYDFYHNRENCIFLSEGQDYHIENMTIAFCALIVEYAVNDKSFLLLWCIVLLFSFFQIITSLKSAWEDFSKNHKP